MQAVAIPPFERFYEEHRSDVLRLLRRRLGADRAEDAFQETFLRALRAYGRSEVIGLAVAVTVFYPQATGYGMLWLLIGFAGIATINGRLFALVFAKYIAAQQTPQT